MVGGFPRKPTAPKPADTVPPEPVEFDEDGRRFITSPVVPAPTRPPSTIARPLPPMPSAPKKPGALPPRPPAPVKPAPRVGPLPPPKIAAPAPAPAPAPAGFKRPPPPTPKPYVRPAPVRHLDPNDVPPGSYGPNWGK